MLVLSDVRSAHNVGAIARTSDAFGVSVIWCCGITPYPARQNDPRLPHIRTKATTMIAKTALGAEKTIKFEHRDNTAQAIVELKQLGYQVYALEQDQRAVPIAQFTPTRPFALVLGNEVKGIDHHLLDQSDQIIAIPQSGHKESLNVAVAAGIALYCLTNQIKPS